jgi:hypothetical protein
MIVSGVLLALLLSHLIDHLYAENDYISDMYSIISSGSSPLSTPSAVWADNSGIAYILSYDGYATNYGPTPAINYNIVGNGASTSNNIPITDISFSQARGIFA